MPSSIVLYASAGNTLHHYAVDVERAAIERRSTLELPEGGQYAWRHPRLPALYFACSNGSPGVLGDKHRALALRMGADGKLEPHGAPITLPSRPIHITVDAAGEYALIAYNDPSGLTVHRIDAQGGIGEVLPQKQAPDVGIFAHQVRVMPANRTVLLVTRGNDANPPRPEDPGALKVFGFRDGQLTNQASIAPGGGHGFGPRHLDFHPAKPWVYVSLERQNRVQLFRAPNDALEKDPAFSVQTLAEPDSEKPEQRAGTIHVHPNGRVLYVANRANAADNVDGKLVFGGGESNIAVFAIDAESGEPKAIQHIDTRGFVPRTFAIDPSGTLMVVANSQPLYVREGEALRHVPTSLAMFRIAEDGRLTYVRSEDIDSGGATLFWMGLVTL